MIILILKRLVVVVSVGKISKQMTRNVEIMTIGLGNIEVPHIGNVILNISLVDHYLWYFTISGAMTVTSSLRQLMILFLSQGLVQTSVLYQTVMNNL
jgi:hypothetical protein